VYDEDEDYINGGDSGGYAFVVNEGKKTAPKAAAPAAKRAPATLSALTCHDGRRPLSGFVLADKSISSNSCFDKWFAPPTIPEGFTGIHQLDLTAAGSAVPVPLGPGLLADERGQLLSETAPARSIAPPQHPPPPTTPAPMPGAPMMRLPPKLDSTTAARALQGFIPFGSDPAKQARYRRYLEYHVASPDTRGSLDTSAGEMDEFYRSATIFRPLSSMMAARFTSSQTSLELSTPDAPGLRRFQSAGTDAEPAAAPTGAASALPPPPPKRLGRELTYWEPARLLCKRFNIAPPPPPPAGFGGGSLAAAPSSSGQHPMEIEREKRRAEYNAKESETMSDLMYLAHQTRSNGTMANADDRKQPDPVDADEAAALALLGAGKTAEEWQLRERPPMDLFAAIFEDDAGQEEDEEEKPQQKPQDDEKPLEAEKPEPVFQVLPAPRNWLAKDRTQQQAESDETSFQIKTPSSSSLSKPKPKKDEPKKDEPKKDEPKKDEPRKDEPRTDEPKKDEPVTTPIVTQQPQFQLPPQLPTPSALPVPQGLLPNVTVVAPFSSSIKPVVSSSEDEDSSSGSDSDEGKKRTGKERKSKKKKDKKDKKAGKKHKKHHKKHHKEHASFVPVSSSLFVEKPSASRSSSSTSSSRPQPAPLHPNRSKALDYM